jgi:serine/threonine protein kinase
MTEQSRLTAALADRYRIERELGQGGMATVYLAQDLRLQPPSGLENSMFEPSRDGSRFLMVRQGGGDKSGDLVPVQNGFNELRAATTANREPK